MQNQRFLNALLKKPVDKTPIWIMRQAGRYLPEYRATRTQAGSFLQLCKTPELACEVTLQPLRRFALDAAILFSDILMVPMAMGLPLHFAEGEGPVFSETVRHEQDIAKLIIPEPEEKLPFVIETVRLLSHELKDKVPLIGFAGSPWTVATYMVEGGGSKNFHQVKKMLYSAPMLLQQLLNKITQATIQYLSAQVKAGAQAIMIFDTWGGILTPEAYQHFSLAYMEKIVKALKQQHHVPVILFSKQCHHSLEQQAVAGCDGLGLDWSINIAEAKKRVGDKVALQGNLDPAILCAEPKVIQQEAEKVLRDFNGNTGHIFNLGHGITPDINPEHVTALVEAVHGFKHSI